MRGSRLVFLCGTAIVMLAMALTALDLAVEDAGVLPDLLVDFLDRLILIAAAVAATLLTLRLSRLGRRTDDLEKRLDQAAREGRAFRAQSRRFIDGLGRAIEAQFEDWGLTPAGTDVAALLLKGATLREVATLRRTSEATIRQQAQSVYRKSGLGSRAELSAYFLEDLFSIGEATMAPRANATEARFDA